MRKVFRNQKGFTLLETLVALGILAVVSSTVGVATFQAVGTQQKIINDGHAINQFRRGVGWLAGDVQMADSTNLVDGVPSDSITLSWTESFGEVESPHISSYVLSSGDLLRVYDGETHTVMRDAISATFTLFGTSVQTELEVDAGGGSTRISEIKLPLGVSQ